MRLPHTANVLCVLLAVFFAFSAFLLLGTVSSNGQTLARPAAPPTETASDLRPGGFPIIPGHVGLNDAGCWYSSIQEAVDAAQPGDVIRLKADRNYTESVTIAGKNLAIEGGYDRITCQTLEPGAHSQISGQGARVVSLDGGSIVSLRNLTITLGSSGGDGGGLYAGGASRATLSNTLVTGNSGKRGGGLHVAAGSEVTLTGGSRVRGNTFERGGWGSLCLW